MASVRISATPQARQLDKIRKRVADGDSASVSGFVQRAAQRARENSAEFGAMIDEGPMATGGP